MQAVPVLAVGRGDVADGCSVAVPEYNFYGKYRRIGEYNDYKWKPPPWLRNVEATRANLAARMAFSSF